MKVAFGKPCISIQLYVDDDECGSVVCSAVVGEYVAEGNPVGDFVDETLLSDVLIVDIKEGWPEMLLVGLEVEGLLMEDAVGPTDSKSVGWVGCPVGSVVDGGMDGFVDGLSVGAADGV